DAHTGDGETALFYTVLSGHLDVINLLLERGARPSVRTRYGGDMVGAALWRAGRGGDPDLYGTVIGTVVAAGGQVPARPPPAARAPRAREGRSMRRRTGRSPSGRCASGSAVTTRFTRSSRSASASRASRKIACNSRPITSARAGYAGAAGGPGAGGWSCWGSF